MITSIFRHPEARGRRAAIVRERKAYDQTFADAAAASSSSELQPELGGPPHSSSPSSAGSSELSDPAHSSSPLDELATGAGAGDELPDPDPRPRRRR